MNGEPSGRPPRHRRSVLESLAEARPARLDPGIDSERRASDLSVVLRSAETPPAPAGPPQRTDPAWPGPWPGAAARRRRRRLVLGSGLTLTAGAAALAVFAATTGPLRAPGV